MNNSPNDLLYFTIRLQELLNISFPEKTHDTLFIEQRVLWATETYERSFRLGDSVELCLQAADLILFKDLHFSRFDTVLQVVSNEFAAAMFDEELKPFALRMLSTCEVIFTKYSLSDDFTVSTEYNLLYADLKERIANWIEENGCR